MPLVTDPIDLKLDKATDDLIIASDLSFTSGTEAVGQSAKVVLELVKGEWFFNQDAGVDYYGKILGHKFDEPAIRSEVRPKLLAVAGVSRIDRLAVSFAGVTRTVRIDWTVITVFGDTVSGSTEVGS